MGKVGFLVKGKVKNGLEKSENCLRIVGYKFGIINLTLQHSHRIHYTMWKQTAMCL